MPLTREELRANMRVRLANPAHLDAAFWTIVQFEHVRESWQQKDNSAS